MSCQSGTAHLGFGRSPVPLRRLIQWDLSEYFLPILYTKMNMNRNRRNSLKTNDRSTLYSIINRDFADGTQAHRTSPRIAATLAAFLLALAALASPSFAKPRPSKSLTVERIYGSPSLSGRLTRGIEWTPDGKRISYLQRQNGGAELWTMDAAGGDRKILVKSSVLEEVMQRRKESAIQSTGLGRVEAENYQWSPIGNALLFVGSSDLVLLDLKTMSSKSG